MNAKIIRLRTDYWKLLKTTEAEYWLTSVTAISEVFSTFQYSIPLVVSVIMAVYTNYTNQINSQSLVTSKSALSIAASSAVNCKSSTFLQQQYMNRFIFHKELFWVALKFYWSIDM